MFSRILPRQIDNGYRGRKLGLWVFAAVVLLKLVQSLAVIFNGYVTARSADGIPLETYPPETAQTVVALFGLSGVYRLFLGLLCVLVLVRYRRAIPLMFVVLLLSYLAVQLLLRITPITRVGTPPGAIVNLVLFALTVLGLALSLTPRRESVVPGGDQATAA